MDVSYVLKEIGLNEGEIKVYLALLKLGPVPVSKLKQETNLHRTTIYDFIEKLLNKGLVNYAIENNVKYFRATNPDKLLEIVQEKEMHVKEILPKLKQLSDSQKEELTVEVYKGKEGLKAHLYDQLKPGEDFVLFGIDETMFKERFPVLMEQHFKREEKLGIKERLLTSEDTEFIYDNKTTTYRYIPKEYFNPTPTVVYGNKIAIIIWDPLTVIIIENANLADSYKKHFELLWKMAKKKQRK